VRLDRIRSTPATARLRHGSLPVFGGDALQNFRGDVPGRNPSFAWWKRQRIGWNDLKAAAPFFGISLVLGTISVLSNVWFLHSRMQSVEATPIGGFLARLALVGTSLSFYFSNVSGR